ncbi:hypothetical protein B0H13DRAFT_2309112 [Mycena leptocephala]|nr:hypothetical protein B0H13DRAFT_2309112 [Mycena leptocephala]
MDSAHDGTVAMFLCTRVPWVRMALDCTSFSCATAPSVYATERLSSRASALQYPFARVRGALEPNQYATAAPPFLCATAPLFPRAPCTWTLMRDGAAFTFPSRSVPSHLFPHVEYPSHARQHSSFMRDDAALVSDGPSLIVLPSSCGISFPCATAFFFHARQRRLLSSDGAFTEYAIAPLCSCMPAVSFIARDGGLPPSVTMSCILCAFFPRATNPPSLRVMPGRGPIDSLGVRDGALSPRTMHYKLWWSLHPPFTCDDALILIHFLSFTAISFMDDAILLFPYMQGALAYSYNTLHGCDISFMWNGAPLLVSDGALTQHLSSRMEYLSRVRSSFMRTGALLVSDGPSLSVFFLT